MNLVQQLEAVLFVADKPTPLSVLAEATQATELQVQDALRNLSLKLDSGSALQLVQIAGGYQMCTRAPFSELVARFLKPQKHRLSRSVMEVLAIVAYRQPITLAEIEAVRGLQSDYGVRQLLERRLAREVGRRPTPGRPIEYGTTQQFLHQFNLNDIEELPQLQLSLPGGDAIEVERSENPYLPGLEDH
jgi:segregation and condensation protein B